MPSIEYTAHALARMAERGVSRDQVEAVLAKPLRSFSTGQGWVIVERGAVMAVITVRAPSKFEKYGDAA